MTPDPSFSRLCSLQRQISDSVLCLSAAGSESMHSGIREAMRVGAPAEVQVRTELGQINHATTFDKESRIVLISLDGLLLHKMPIWLAAYGYTSVELLNDGLERLADLRPRAVILHMTTRGGLMTGVPEAAAKLRQFSRDVAPTYGFTDTHCLSAGHWLASGCSYFHASPSSMVGGIGAHRVMFDSSEASAMDGETVHLRTSGPLKGAGYPGTRVSDRQLEAMQKEVDAVGDDFKKVIRARWPGASPQVFDGGTHRAASAEGSTICDGSNFNSATAHARGVMAAVLRFR